MSDDAVPSDGDVHVHALVAGPAIGDLLDPYLGVDRARADGRCWVLANMVAGLDGTAAVDGRVGALSHGADAELFRLLRTVADVVLVGAETVRREGYGPVRLPEQRRAERRSDGRSAVPPIAVVTRSLALDWSAALFADGDGPRPLVITCGGADAGRRAKAAEHAEVIVAGDDRVDLGLALAALGERGHQVVLTEGGPTLLGLLVDGGHLDELCLTLAPMMGGDPLPVAVTPPGGRMTGFRRCHTAADANGTLFLRYEVDHHGR